MAILRRKKMDDTYPPAIDLDAPREPVRRVEYAHGDDNITSVDRAVAALEDELNKYAPPKHREPEPEPMPGYVEPREGVPAVVALSAEAIVKDFEKTAKHIEKMAESLAGAATVCAGELIHLTNKYEAMAKEIEEVVAHIKDTAASYRDEAKSVFVRIEDTTLRMKEVRELSETMRERLAASGNEDVEPST